MPQRLADLVHRSSWVLNGRQFTRLTQTSAGPNETVFNNAYEARVDSRRIVIANGWTNIGPQDLQLHEMTGVAVCAVELPTLAPVFVVQPRTLPMVDRYGSVPTGDAEFDARFVVAMVPGLDPGVVTSGVRDRLGAHDDWAFVGHDNWLACVSRGAFESDDDVVRRVEEVVGVVDAFPESVVPKRIDHSVDDLAARIRGLHSADDAITFLEQLSASDRERLADSDTPLAAFSDVTTRDEAIARFGALDVPQRMALLAMFKRSADDTNAG